MAYVRRRSSAFSRGKSKYRGVSGHNGRWEARIGSFGGRKNVSMGLGESQWEVVILPGFLAGALGVSAAKGVRTRQGLEMRPGQAMQCSTLHTHTIVQVSFGIFESEDEAARQYDRALILEKVGVPGVAVGSTSGFAVGTRMRGAGPSLELGILCVTGNVQEGPCFRNIMFWHQPGTA